MKKVSVIGSGLSGSVIARLFKDDGYEVDVYENNKIGGMCSDYYDVDSKTHVNNFGAHIWHFDDNTQKNLPFLKKFGEFKDYNHKVLCIGNGACIYWPINKSSKAFFDSYNSKDILDEFILSYSRKMWGEDFDKIYDNIKSRFEPKPTKDNKFFGNEKQYLLNNGFASFFDNLLEDIPVIKHKVNYETDFKDSDLVILTAPIDDFYNYKFGELKYTGLRFDKAKIKTDTYVTPTPVVNLNAHEECIRIVNYTQLNKTLENIDFEDNVIVKEYVDKSKKFYPILDEEQLAVFNKYKIYNSIFCSKIKLLGRMANYKYLDMDQCVDEAVKLYERLTNEEKI
jgi:UDP-galactopyranose mutase